MVSGLLREMLVPTAAWFHLKDASADGMGRAMEKAPTSEPPGADTVNVPGVGDQVHPGVCQPVALSKYGAQLVGDVPGQPAINSPIVSPPTRAPYPLPLLFLATGWAVCPAPVP